MVFLFITTEGSRLEDEPISSVCIIPYTSHIQYLFLCVPLTKMQILNIIRYTAHWEHGHLICETMQFCGYICFEGSAASVTWIGFEGGASCTVPLKCQYPTTKLHDPLTQTTIILILTTVEALTLVTGCCRMILY